MRRWLVFLEYSLACWVGWLLLVRSTEGAELIAGTLAALIAAGVAVGGCEIAGRVGAGTVVTWSRRLPGLSWQVQRGTARVFGTLRRPTALRRRGMGRMTAVPLTALGTAPRDVARRALAIWERSLAPDEYVVCVEREGGRLVVHQLPPVPGLGGGARRLPGAEPRPPGGRTEDDDAGGAP